MTLNQTHNIYIQSKYRNTGTTSNYTITLPEIINSDANVNIFKISLQNFAIYHNWYLIKAGSNTITFNNTDTLATTTITIPDGTYSYQKLVRKIISLYPYVNVSWDTPSNKLTFNFTDNHEITMDGIGELIGFTSHTTYSGTSITSTTPMTPYKNTHLIIHLTNIQPTTNQSNYDNMSGEIRQSNILSRILINAPPFQLITYQQTLDSEGIYTNDNTVGNLEFYITDAEGNELEGLPDHEFEIKIECYDVEDVDETEFYNNIKEIKDTLRDLYLMKHLKTRQI